MSQSYIPKPGECALLINSGQGVHAVRGPFKKFDLEAEYGSHMEIAVRLIVTEVVTGDFRAEVKDAIPLPRHTVDS